MHLSKEELQKMGQVDIRSAVPEELVGISGIEIDIKRMMADIEAGNVNCVIIKDLSRLGRDYIEAGRLIQKTFPAFHVRFIALTDNFDSQTADHNTKSLVLSVKNFINDSYCRDISQKVKSYQKARREKRKYIEAFEDKKVYVEFRWQEEFNKMLIMQEYSLSEDAKRLLRISKGKTQFHGLIS